MVTEKLQVAILGGPHSAPLSCKSPEHSLVATRLVDDRLKAHGHATFCIDPILAFGHCITITRSSLLSGDGILVGSEGQKSM